MGEAEGESSGVVGAEESYNFEINKYCLCIFWNSFFLKQFKKKKIMKGIIMWKDKKNEEIFRHGTNELE